MNQSLIKLVTLLFSFGCNAADTERFWSITGSIKTKLRNHMKPETLKWVAVVKLGIQTQNVKEGKSRKQCKCMFGLPVMAHDAATSVNRLQDEEGISSDEEVEEGEGVRGMAALDALLRQIENDCQITEGFSTLDGTWGEPIIGRALQVSLHYMDLIAFVLNMEQPCECRILEDVFDLLAMEGWDEFWFISEEALNEEAEAIDLMTREGNLCVAGEELAQVVGWTIGV